MFLRPFVLLQLQGLSLSAECQALDGGGGCVPTPSNSSVLSQLQVGTLNLNAVPILLGAKGSVPPHCPRQVPLKPEVLLDDHRQ